MSDDAAPTGDDYVLTVRISRDAMAALRWWERTRASMGKGQAVGDKVAAMLVGAAEQGRGRLRIVRREEGGEHEGA